MARLLAAETAFDTSIRRSAIDTTAENVANGLSALLDSGAPMSPSVAKVYQPFYPDVWTAIDERGEANWIVVALQCGTSAEGVEGGKSHFSCLTIQTIVDPKRPPSWAALETVIDKKSLTPATTFKVDLICSFDPSAAERFRPSDAVHLVLRFGYKGQGRNHDDVPIGSIPVTTLPLEHTVSAANSFPKGTGIDDLEYVNLLMFLPVTMTNNLRLYHFSIRTPQS